MAIAQLSLESAGILSVWVEVSSEQFTRYSFSKYLSLLFYTDALVWCELPPRVVATATIVNMS
jgi:hypothetical protein